MSVDPYDAYLDDLADDQAAEFAYEEHMRAVYEQCAAGGHLIPLGDLSCRCRSQASKPVPEPGFTPADLEASKAVGF